MREAVAALEAKGVSRGEAIRRADEFARTERWRRARALRGELAGRSREGYRATRAAAKAQGPAEVWPVVRIAWLRAAAEAQAADWFQMLGRLECVGAGVAGGALVLELAGASRRELEPYRLELEDIASAAAERRVKFTIVEGSP